MLGVSLNQDDAQVADPETLCAALRFQSPGDPPAMPTLILASTSRYRKELLSRLGVTFVSEAPGVDEDAVKHDASLTPRQVAEVLAERKARAVAERHPDAVVIGSDQLAHLDGTVLGKPGTAAHAVAQLARLSGRTHELVTAVCIVHPGGVERCTDLAHLTMRPLDAAAVDRYVAADQPLDCAGAYKLECRGIALFSAVSCADHTAITGLPLIWTGSVLAKLGFAVP
jgi:septum formation protein